MWNKSAISRALILAGILLLAIGGRVASAETTLAEACAPYTTTPTGGNVGDRAIAYGDAVFWRVEKGGATNYILGTVHSQDRRVAGLSPRQRLILAHSQRLLIEVVPDAAANRTYLQAMFANSGPGLQEALPEPIFEKLGELGADYGLPPERLDELAPWAAFSQIGRPKPVRGPTLDRLIYETAVQMDKTVIGLETMEELTDTLASLPREDQITILEDTVCNHARIIRDAETLLELYLDGDLAGMVAFNEQPHYDEAIFERFMETVLYRRNERMFERMLPYLEQGGSFIAVGALHLPGKNGLLQMLAGAGYRITPVRNGDG